MTEKMNTIADDFNNLSEKEQNVVLHKIMAQKYANLIEKVDNNEDLPFVDRFVAIATDFIIKELHEKIK
jgi:kynurenine formamidase